tara:strand:- start:107 stop:307 length:201 start_codon:yes stop_codon:yes gene_type:complete
MTCCKQRASFFAMRDKICKLLESNGFGRTRLQTVILDFAKFRNFAHFLISSILLCLFFNQMRLYPA